MTVVTHQYQLEVKGNNKVLVPGCEPTSSLSSKTLSAYLASGVGCKNALVDLNAALAAIPGSFVKYGINFNRGVRQKWFVLPPIGPTCPCQTYTDYFSILRQIDGVELPVEESYDKCDIIGMGYCPSPDFNNAPEPPQSPYIEEGQFPAGGGILPPVPPWAVD